MRQALFYRELRNLLCLSALVLLLFSSCRSTRQSVSPFPGEYTVRMSRPSASRCKNVKHVRQYELVHRDVPVVFNGCRLASTSDLHHRSLLKEEGLEDATRSLNDLYPDALLIGGDLYEGCEYAPSVIAALGAVKMPLGTCAVLGNSDYEVYYDDVLEEMERQGIHLPEHKVDTLRWNGEHIAIAGAHNPFDIGQSGQPPTLPLAPKDFVILPTHISDHTEDVPITNTDLVLARHTHGGQVTVLGLYAPTISFHHGQCFLMGLKYNSSDTPIIITNGIGTSNKNVRLFAPSEIMVVTLLSCP